MRARYKKELNKVSLTIETNQFYREDYQMKMLKENNIHGLIKVECHHINNDSHFLYDISNMCSLKKKFELVELSSGEIVNLVNSLVEIVNELQQYLLTPDCLLLDPNLIFWEKNKWNFLYLPVNHSNLNKAFHGLTEYFVKTLDYSEIEGIKLASFLHKESLHENFNLKEMLDKYEERYQTDVKEVEEIEKVMEGKTIDKVEEIMEREIEGKGWYSTNVRGITTEDFQTGESLGKEKEINTRKTRFTFLGRGKKDAKVKTQKNRWGDWEDLIIE